MTVVKRVEQQNTKRHQRRGKQWGRSQQRTKLGIDLFVRIRFEEICLRQECCQPDPILPAFVRRVILLQWPSPVCRCHLHWPRFSRPFVSENTSVERRIARNTIGWETKPKMERGLPSKREGDWLGRYLLQAVEMLDGEILLRRL